MQMPAGEFQLFAYLKERQWALWLQDRQAQRAAELGLGKGKGIVCHAHPHSHRRVERVRVVVRSRNDWHASL